MADIKLDDEQRDRIAEAMKSRRGHIGISQKEAVEVAPVGITTWRELEQGARDVVRPNTLSGVARGLQWPPDALVRVMDGEDPTQIEDWPASDERLDRIERDIELLKSAVWDLQQAVDEADGR